jgi:hypothetical protein
MGLVRLGGLNRKAKSYKLATDFFSFHIFYRQKMCYIKKILEIGKRDGGAVEEKYRGGDKISSPQNTLSH